MTTSARIAYLIYRLVLWPLAKITIHVAAGFNDKVRRGLELRKPMPDGVKPWLNFPSQTQPIWIHCASGEFEYAKPVIRELKKRAPELKILVTFFSPSIAQAVRQFPGVDYACPVPWDEASAINEFLEWHRPRALLIARTDTWPEMVRLSHLSGVPTLLFSATLPETSGRARGIGRILSRAVFAQIEQIFCVTQDDLKTFTSLGCGDRTVVAGDTRYDQVLARLRDPKPYRHELFATAPAERLLIAGSTWPEDEEILLKVAAKMRGRLGVVLVPHEPTASHLAELQNQAQALGLPSVRYSSTSSWDPLASILIVDQIGILAELYRQGRFAFVGGSFRKTVHSVMEPLATGALTFVGPKHLNNREALHFKTIASGMGDFTCVVETDSAESMTRALEIALDTPSQGQIQDELIKMTGQSQRVADWLLERLKQRER